MTPKTIHFPKYHIVLIESNNIFINAFVCFLDKIYLNGITNKKDIRIFLRDCLTSYFTDTLLSVKSSNLYTYYFYFNKNDLTYNNEIFKFISKDKFNYIINHFIKNNKKTFNFYKHKKNNCLDFNDSSCIKTKLTGEEQEIINLILKQPLAKVSLN